MAGESRVEVGFSGGQVMAVRLTADQLESLRQALRSADKLAGEKAGWHELATDDGNVDLDLCEVVFVRVAGGPHTIGFSGA